MFINFTNHPSSQWGSSQRSEAERYGTIRDIQFPNISPIISEKELNDLVNEYIKTIEQLKPEAVLCQGEMTFTYRFVKRLSQKGILALAACSERITQEKLLPNGSTQKVSNFVFVRFRAYESDIETIQERNECHE